MSAQQYRGHVLQDRLALSPAGHGRACQQVLDTALETFTGTAEGVARRVKRRDGSVSTSWVGPDGMATIGEPVEASRADQVLLRRATPPPLPVDGRIVTVVDLFSGCGGLSLGVVEATRALGLGCDIRLAVDFELAATEVFRANFAPAQALTADILTVFDGRVGTHPTRAERRLASAVGDLDLLIGGPPCQGHSDLNNRTRRSDQKNELYFSMVRAAEVLRPEHVLIENVPGALNDRRSVVQRSMDALEDLGYAVSNGVVDMSSIGVPQKRKRLVVLASRTRPLNVDSIVSAYVVPTRSVRWAIEDLESAQAERLLDTPCNSASETRRRIKYLFDRDLYELPDSERPPCHATGDHTYSSIYGRLAWDAPSQTITTGFYSMCMGRYVHPSKQRTLTAHEAARLQMFPDYFDFSCVRRRGDLATMIGNAVPMKLSYLFARELLL